MSLKLKVALAFCLLVIGPFLVVGWMSARQASVAMQEEVGKTMLQLVRQNHVTIEKTIASVNDKTVTFLNNHFFSGNRQLAFWTGVETLADMSEADATLERLTSDGTEYTLYMKNTENRRTTVDTAYKTRGFKYTDDGYPGLPAWAAQTEKDGGGGSIRLIVTPDGRPTVAFMRSILQPMNYGRSIGLLVVTKLEVLLMEDLVSVQLPADTGLFLLNEKRELLMQVGQEQSEARPYPADVSQSTEGFRIVREGGAEWLYAFSYRPKFDTRLIYRIPLESITGQLTLFQWMILITSAVYLLLVLAFVLIVLRMFWRPLARLVKMTRTYEPGKKPVADYGPPRKDEFGILHGAFIRMTRRLDRTVEDNYLMTIRQKELELSTLHSQMTPHLLYNTLDSIYWYAVDSGNKDVGMMVKDLSKLLRIGLSRGKTIIAIAEELEHVRAYIRLQMMRYPQAFEVVWDVDESLSAYMTPKLVLQPLVENAIFHGVSGMDGEGSIRIRVAREDDEIRMTVADNGFVEADVQLLEAIVAGTVKDKGYGIRNVQQRIRLHFGEAYGLRYARREGGGVEATVRIPVVARSDADG